MIKQNLIHNCESIFEHQFNLITLYIELKTQLQEKTQFNVQLASGRCQFKTGGHILKLKQLSFEILMLGLMHDDSKPNVLNLAVVK